MFSWQAASAEEFEALHQLRLAAMCPSLQAIGLYDPARSRARFAGRFHPGVTRWIVWQERRIGFSAMRHEADACYLDHLYILPTAQGLGAGSWALRAQQLAAAAQAKAIVLCALRDSPANHFYRRHGFVPTGEDEWDIWYRWQR
ncbi:GNAT family N-acetyltransferase [Vogesella facilis]|uniref:GNAT family N-acetyltransferase n=1 Tax=Vogesella facilis TaxID=1655232 RepID=A0ABV7RAQ1_9NEIS